ncbi:hypothetical protein HMPREF3199_00029 [Enterococcus faecium]|nr:hypothetical protein HMPREF3199_00029 [Enterococcus faecium]
MADHQKISTLTVLDFFIFGCGLSSPTVKPVVKIFAILPVAKIVYRQKTLERNFSFARLLLCKNK